MAFNTESLENGTESEERTRVGAGFSGIRRVDGTFAGENKREKMKVSLETTAYGGEGRGQKRKFTKMSA